VVAAKGRRWRFATQDAFRISLESEGTSRFQFITTISARLDLQINLTARSPNGCNEKKGHAWMRRFKLDLQSPRDGRTEWAYLFHSPVHFLSRLGRDAGVLGSLRSIC